MKIVGVGALGRLVSDSAYGEQVVQWASDGFIDMSATEAAAIAERGAHTLRVAVDAFADLDDGTRVVTDDRDCSYRFDSQPIAIGLVAGATLSERELEELSGFRREMVENSIREAVMDWDEPHERWSPLVAALERRGISTTPHELETIPFSVEMTPELDGRLGHAA